MNRVNSLSGGKTSSYIAANYAADYDVFALVRIDDEGAKFPDAKIRQYVEDKIGKPFIATAEDDTIIYTMMDLEQYIGREITWVSGDTFDEVIKKKGNYLPNIMTRFCTSDMKMKPIFHWWAENIGEPVDMRIGFRANEQGRAKRMIDKLDGQGLDTYTATFEKHKDGRNKWEDVKWRTVSFPLISDGIFKDDVENYWADKPVRFATFNNCVGCFHRNPMFLNKMAQDHPNKMRWFADKEKQTGNRFKKEVSYDEIISYKSQIELFDNDFKDCDSGYCGI